MIRTFAATSLAVLSGCATLGHPRVTASPCEGDQCRLPLVHVSVDRNRWYVPIDTGDLGERLFFLDTGYSFSTCDDAWVTELGLRTYGRVTIRGEAGNVIGKKAKLPPFSIAGHRVEGLVCVVRDLGKTSSIDDPTEVSVAGVLGADVLREFRVTIDPSESAIWLDAPGQRPLPRKGSTPLRREYGLGIRFTIPAEVAGHRKWPVVDTGASGTFLDGKALRLQPTAKRDNVRLRASGTDGVVVRDLVYYKESVAVDEVEPRTLTITDRDRAPWVHGLLGLDWLSHYRQEYDFRHRRAMFTPVQAARVVSWSDWRAARP